MDCSITPITRLACEGRHRLIRDGDVTNIYSQRKNIPDNKTVLKGPVVTDYDRLPPDISLYEVGDRGKTRFEEQYSGMWEWKPAKAKVPQPAAKHYEPGGKRFIQVSNPACSIFVHHSRFHLLAYLRCFESLSVLLDLFIYYM